MLSESIRAALRILMFRAGPEDFPYDPSGKLNYQIALMSTLAFTAYFAVLTPPLTALSGGLTSVGSFYLIAWVILKLRRLENRLSQTVNALLSTNGLLTLAMVPPMIQVGPLLMEFNHALAEHPDWINQPERLPQIPAGPLLLLLIFSVWQLAVCSRIFGRAANTSAVAGASILIIALMGLMVVSAAVGSLLGAHG